MDKYANQAMDTRYKDTIRKSTVRERLTCEIVEHEEKIREYKNRMKECEDAIKLLDKNKDLEVLVNLLQN